MGVDNYFSDRILDHFAFHPTECQLTLFQALSTFSISHSDIDLMVVKGYAGTGKTTAIASYVKTLKEFSISFKLMAPTGRSAKLLAGYSGEKAFTIHKQIYRQKSLDGGVGVFDIDINKDKGTIYIVDESSLISSASPFSPFGTGNLVEDLIGYVRQGVGNKLIFIGDDAQLPPIASSISPALDLTYLSFFGEIIYSELKTVVRQGYESGILFNATILRKIIKSGSLLSFPHLDGSNFEDVHFIDGSEVLEAITQSIDTYGVDETVVVCRSNKRANRYNSAIRSSILYKEEQLTRGDRLMVVKNCYQFLEGIEDLEFIANGDVAELIKISKYEDRYGFHFAEATLSFPDYNNVEIKAKVILDTLLSESASLTEIQQKQLYEGVFADYDNIKQKRKRNKAVREDVYYNALQIKYASAITCHKAQGGQWKSVFVDNPFWSEDLSIDDLKWLYTAITRSVTKLYFINFNKKFYE